MSVGVSLPFSLRIHSYVGMSCVLVCPEEEWTAGMERCRPLRMLILEQVTRTQQALHCFVH